MLWWGEGDLSWNNDEDKDGQAGQFVSFILYPT